MAYSAGISLKGAPGTPGSQIYFTATAPTDSTASATNGDFAFTQDTNVFYQRQSGSWVATSNTLKGIPGVKGDTGLVGAAGSNLIAAMSAPGPTDGNPGDHYIVLSTGEVYGPKGSDNSWPDTGYTVKGAAGQRGSQIFSGVGAPPANQATLNNGTVTGGIAGDVYYDTTPGNPQLYFIS